MNLFESLLLAAHVLVAIGICGFVLLQHGKGADMGAAFGSGSSGSLFGATGSANFLSRTTAVLAAVFFACTLLLAYFGNLRPADSGSVLDRAGAAAPATVPAPAASGAAQIPGTTAPVAPPATSGNPAPAAPAVGASGAAQIPTR